MDVVNRYWQIIRALTLARGLISGLLCLFYVLAAVLLLTLESKKQPLIILIFTAIPACGFLALATERLIQYSAAGATIGLPQNIELLRRSQIAILLLFVGIPACISLWVGADVTTAGLLLVPAALGVLVTLYARWLFLVWIILAVGSRFKDSFDGILPGLENRTVRICLIVTSLAALYWWLDMAKRVELRTRGAPGYLADARHEKNPDKSAAVGQLTSAQIDGLEKAYDAELSGVTAGVSDEGISSRALSLGLAVDTRPNWKGVVKTVGIGWLILFALHGTHQSIRDKLFFWLSVWAAGALFSRVNAVRMAWQLHSAEEALLSLTPRWPNERSVKTLVVSLIVQCQMGAWVTWLAIILPFVILGWLGPIEAGASILCAFATSCGSSGALLYAMARPNVKVPSYSTVCLLLVSVAGVAAFLVGEMITPYYRIIGLGLILLPLLIGLTRFSLRPLQFPAQVISKQ